MPYAPGVTNIAGQLFGQGIMAGGEGINEAVKGYAQLKQENDFLTGGFENLMKTRAQLGMPLDPDVISKFQSGSLGAKRGIVSSLASDPAYRSSMQQMQQTQGDQQILKNIAAGVDDPFTGVSAFSPKGYQLGAEAKFSKLADLAQGNQDAVAAGAQPVAQMGTALAGNPITGPIGSALMSSAAGAPQTGAGLDASTAMSLARRAGLSIADQLSLSKGAMDLSHGRWFDARARQDMARDAQGLIYDEDPVTGERTVRLGNSLIKSGTNPDKQTQPGVIELPDENGNPSGVRATIGPGNKISVIKGPKQVTEKVRQAVDEATGKKVPGMYINMNDGTMHQHQLTGEEKLESLLQPSGQPGTAPAFPSGQVKMKDPKGRIGTAPKENAAELIKRGYTIVE